MTALRVTLVTLVTLAGCIIGGTHEDGVRCWIAVRGSVTRTVTRPDGSVVTDRCQARPVLGDRP